MRASISPHQNSIVTIYNYTTKILLGIAASPARSRARSEVSRPRAIATQVSKHPSKQTAFTWQSINAVVPGILVQRGIVPRHIAGDCSTRKAGMVVVEVPRALTVQPHFKAPESQCRYLQSQRGSAGMGSRQSVQGAAGLRKIKGRKASAWVYICVQ
jgi:hypothetical protein